jgi:hypothetical protein
VGQLLWFHGDFTAPHINQRENPGYTSGSSARKGRLGSGRRLRY